MCGPVVLWMKMGLIDPIEEMNLGRNRTERGEGGGTRRKRGDPVL